MSCGRRGGLRGKRCLPDPDHYFKGRRRKKWLELLRGGRTSFCGPGVLIVSLRLPLKPG
jgi:hypothetical protein